MLKFCKVTPADKEQLFQLIDSVLSGLPRTDFFIPYDEWELENMFDEDNYAYLYGAYDGDKLVGIAQLYISQEMLSELKDLYSLEGKKICELGGNLVLPDYRGRGITKSLLDIEKSLAIEMGFDYIFMMGHPENHGGCNSAISAGLKYIETRTLSNGFIRNIYCLKTEN